MYPEEKMAKKILARAGVEPPFDLEVLIKKYASVEYISFPIDADGVTIGLGAQEKPRILINIDKPKTRQQFTLAHELGHVIIPWHTGIITSHTNGGDEGDDEYSEMEREANRFASEILIPTDWVLKEFKWQHSFADQFNKAFNKTEASRDVFLIKIFNTLEYPVFCVQKSSSGEVLKTYKCGRPPFPTGDYSEDVKGLDEYFSGFSLSREEFCAGDRDFVVWVFKTVEIEELDDRPWRDIIAQILEETSLNEKLASINAILPGQVRGYEKLSVDELCTRVMFSYENRPSIERAVKHPLFAQYVIKRVIELRNKNK